MAQHGILLLRLSLAIVFLWFGALKFLPRGSPAEDLATRTISVLTGGAVGPNMFARFPFMPTLEGQYILKNLVLISAGVVVGATVRGGHLEPDPE